MLRGRTVAAKGAWRVAMASEVPATRRAMFARLLRDRDGFVIVTVALLLVVLIGFAALAAETGLWYVIKRQNQSAADTAALSGAFEKLAGQPYSDMCGFAQRDAARNGFVFLSYPAFPRWYRILRYNSPEYSIRYNILCEIERGSDGGPG